VIGLVQRRLCVLLASGAAALSVWNTVPGTLLDRGAFTAVAGGFVNGPLFVSGAGSHEKPWQLRAFSTEAKPDKRQAPVIVSLGDDLEGFFQASPPAPIDMAVIFTNFQRLGAKKAATAAVLSWEAPDPIGLTAFERSLAGFDSLVMAAPLSRGPVPSSMPPSFRRASVPLESVKGDVTALPVVNRIPIPGVILGGDNTASGFSVLESEAPGEGLPLFACWEDRVIFSFPLLTVLQRLNVPPEELEIHLGKYVKLGPNGPVAPIDSFGRLNLPGKKMGAYAEISAEALIDGGDDLFPKQAPDPVILRDDRSAAEPATKAFSRSLSAIIAVLASEDALSGSRDVPRLSREWETGLLAVVTLALTVCFGVSRFSRQVLAMVFIGVCLAAQWIGFGLASVWLPGLSVLAGVLTAYFVTLVLGDALPVAGDEDSEEELVPVKAREVVPEVVVMAEPEADEGVMEIVVGEVAVEEVAVEEVAVEEVAVEEVAVEEVAVEEVAVEEVPKTADRFRRSLVSLEEIPAVEEISAQEIPVDEALVEAALAAPVKPARKTAKAPVKKAAVKKEPAKKEPVKKAAAKKAPAAKQPAKKAVLKKSPAPKSPTKTGRSKKPAVDPPVEPPA